MGVDVKDSKSGIVTVSNSSRTGFVVVLVKVEVVDESVI